MTAIPPFLALLAFSLVSFWQIASYERGIQPGLEEEILYHLPNARLEWLDLHTGEAASEEIETVRSSYPALRITQPTP